MSNEQLVSELTHYDEEINWLNDYERQFKTETGKSIKKKDYSNYSYYLPKYYSLEISSDDDYRSSSIKEFDAVERSVKGKKIKWKKSRPKYLNYLSRHRKAIPKRKKNNCKLNESRYPFHLDRTRITHYDVEEPICEYYVKKRRPKVTYPTSRLIKRRQMSPKTSNRRFMKKNVTKDSANNMDIKFIQEWPDQRVFRRNNNNNNNVYCHSDLRRVLRNVSLNESSRKRSTDSIYINPRFDRNHNQEEEQEEDEDEEEATAKWLNGGKKEFKVRRCYVDKTNENSFQKRLSGGSNFSGCSTNNQYCPRLDGPCSCEEETNKSMKICNTEKGRSLSSSSKRKEEDKKKKNICEKKNYNWTSNFHDISKSKSVYTSSKSLTSISSTRSTKGVVTFDKNVLISERTSPCREVSRSTRKNDKSSFIEKKVRYEPKCIRTNDNLIKDKDDLCCHCKNEQLDDMKNRKLCNLVQSKEGKILMKCCCSGNEQKNDDEKCNEYCCCPENLKFVQISPKRDISTTYEKCRKNKDFLHSISLSGKNNNYRIDSTNNCKKDKNDLSTKKPFLDSWNKCNERLKEVSKDYQKLSNNLKTMRDICYHRPDYYSRETKMSPKRRTIDSRSPNRSKEIEHINEYCDCTDLFRPQTTLPLSTCPYERSYDEFETRHDIIRSRKKLEKDSTKKFDNFCDKIKATNRNIDNKLKENLNRRNKFNENNRIYQDECQCDGETSVQELWKPVKKSTIRRKEYPNNSVDLRIVKPKYSYGKTSLDKILIYPPKDVAGPPLTLFKNSSNISCQVKGNEYRGYRYNVTYVQKFISPTWRPEIDCPGNRIRHRRNECDCSSDYG